MATLTGAGRCPLGVAVRACSRAHDELLAAAVAEQAALFYGGTTNALAAVAEAGRRRGVPFALDLEDFHSEEQAAGAAGRRTRALVDRIESGILREAVFVTASSEAIADAYGRKYGIAPIVVHNVFPLPKEPPRLSSPPDAPLSLYWFSQTIGPSRGLEDAIRALGVAGIRAELHLRGRAIAGYVESLQRLAYDVAPGATIVVHPPASPDAMVDLCRRHDVGLALEPAHNVNNSLALSNKALTYVAAGLAVALTNTPGQSALARDLGAAALVYAPGDVATLAAGLERWAVDRGLLRDAKSAAWRVAERRWRWDHHLERDALLGAVAAALGAPGSPLVKRGLPVTVVHARSISMPPRFCGREPGP